MADFYGAGHYPERPLYRLLERLSGVQEHKHRPGEYTALCPAHPDKNPSLAIREVEDGVVLLRCWAGCTALEVVQAVNLELADLFVRHVAHRHRPARNRIWPNYKKILATLKLELTVVLLAAEDLAKGQPLSDADKERLGQAIAAIRKAQEAANV